jgi:hypothetical protein
MYFNATIRSIPNSENRRMDGWHLNSPPQRPQILPLYTYVPGLTPHPASGDQEAVSSDVQQQRSEPLSHGCLLFNAGYYWEAHEAWETEWKRLGRVGPAADFLKGLIKLAACGVKCLERNPRGAVRHAKRAMQLFQQAHASGNDTAIIPLTDLLSMCHRLAAAPPLANEDQRRAAACGGVPLLGNLPDLPCSR